jgi:hypothetical protein
MGKVYTSGTRQLAVQIESSLRDRLDERVKSERRTLRAVVEMALTVYLDSPINGTHPAPEQPKRGRPAKKK